MKVLIISSLQPFGHYTQILTEALSRMRDMHVYIAAEDDEANTHLKNCGAVFPVWKKGSFFFIPIFKKILNLKPDLIHIQHEFTMYGGGISALILPVMMLGLQILGYPIVTTIHAVPPKRAISKSFIRTFTPGSPIPASVLNSAFMIIFRLIAYSSKVIITHTELAKNELTLYGISREKIVVIPTIVPEKVTHNRHPENYLFYFGYIAPRKGLEVVINSFIEFHKKHKQFRLKLAGNIIPGQERYLKKIRHLIRRNTAIEYIGAIYEEHTLDELYERAYAVVIPAKQSISASGPLYHARGYHACILASDCGHLSEEIAHEKDGLLIQDGQWREAFERVVNDRELRDRLIAETKELAGKRSALATAEHYLRLYKSLLIR